MCTLTIFLKGLRLKNGSAQGTFGMKFESDPDREP